MRNLVEPLPDRDTEAYRRLNATRHPYALGERIDTAVFRRAALQPDAPAVRGVTSSLTYGELVSRTKKLEQKLQAMGCGIGDVVALVLPRSVNFAPAALAALRTGCAYAPLAPDWPRPRLEAVIARLNPRVVISEADSSRAGEVTIERFERGASVPVGPSHKRENSGGGATPACVLFTSGSTGDPKGAVLPHFAITRLFTDRYGLFHSDTMCLSATAVQWDVWAYELWATLAQGGTLWLHEERLLSPGDLQQAISEGVNTLWLTTSLFNVFVDEALDSFTGLRVMMTGGERQSPRRIERFLKGHPDVHLLNGYGPVEGGMFGSLASLKLDEDKALEDVPIGLPVTNTEVYILDLESRNTVAQVGATGEIALAGDGVALEYLGDRSATEEKFKELELFPFGKKRVYLTGDLGSLGEDGQLWFSGRADRQFKLHGVRIEPDEIEAVLTEHPQISEAVVLPESHTDGHISAINAYVVSNLDAESVLAWARNHLPAAQLPAQVIPVDSLPRTETGKLDRGALTDMLPSARREEGQSLAVLAETSDPLTVEHIAKAMAAILGRPVVHPDESFIELGGDSLQATRLAAHLGAATGAHVPVASVLEAPTPAGLTTHLQRSMNPAFPSIPATPPPSEPLPLSPGQKRFFFAHQLDPADTSAILQSVHLIEGLVDSSALTQAWRDVVSRNDVLHTVVRFRPPTSLVQELVDPNGLVLATDQNYSGETISAASALRAAQHERRPFNLAEEPPIRALLIPGKLQSALIVTQHHISTDAWSEKLLLQQLGERYTALLKGDQSKPALQRGGYRSYSLWMQQVLAQSGEPQLAYWREALRDLPDLPAWKGSATAGRVISRHWSVDLRTVEQWRATATQSGTALLSILAQRLAKAVEAVTSASEFGLGVMTSGRVHPAFDETLGFFSNPVVARLKLTPGRDWELRGIHHAVRDALRHDLVPFDEVVATISPPRTRRHPLFQVLLVAQTSPADSLSLTGTKIRRLDLPWSEDPFELTVEVSPSPSGGMDGVVAAREAAGTECLNAIAKALTGGCGAN